MAPEEHQANDFIPYPIDRVVGTLIDGTQARAAIEVLLQRGVDPAHIDLLYGESGLHRLDPDGTQHGFWARFQRRLINTLGVNAESSHLEGHVEDLRAGRIVLMVLVSTGHTREEIAETLRAHGAQHVGFFGKWTMEALDIPPVQNR